MEEAKVTDEQLKKGNEPEFDAALDAKKQAEVNSAQAPKDYRAAEKDALQESKAEAGNAAKQGLQNMHDKKAGVTGAVSGDKGATKAKDEAERARIATEMEAIYNKTKTEVTAILDGLDGKVNAAFDEGEKGARSAYEDLVETRMAAWKKTRYEGEWGNALWLKDKVMSLPSEVNVFYDEGRKVYLEKMDAAVERIADIVGGELGKAKTRIAQGRADITKYVETQPKNLRELAQESAQEIGSKFDELEQTVQEKQSGVVDSLAQKYVEARDKLDEEINKHKEENKDFIDKAKEKIGGALDTISKLKDMLLGVLAKAAGVIDKIIADPIGFLGNLTSAIKMGLDGFIGNIGQHLKAGLMGWLFGELGEAGITMPESLDFKGILQLVLQVLGLTWENLKTQIKNMVGPEIVAGIEKGVGIFQKVSAIFQRVIAEGPIALWEMLQEKLADMKDQVMGQIEDFLVTKVITAGSPGWSAC